MAFFAAVSRHLLIRCQRCGRCCTKSEHIALRPDDCERMARCLDLSLEEFLELYTLDHHDPGQSASGAREIRRTDKGCPFYDEMINGCKFYEARPAVCRCYPCLTEENLQLSCQGRLAIYTNCPASVELSSRLLSKISKPEEGTGSTRSDLELDVLGGEDGEDLDAVSFLLMLYSMAVEEVFGEEAALESRRRLHLTESVSSEMMERWALIFLKHWTLHCTS